MANYHFGIEIEVIVEPHLVRPNLNTLHALYYGKLAASLRKRGLKAKSDDLQSRYGKRPEHYDKWWITKDGSLGSEAGVIQMEAVSPVMNCRSEWDEEIDVFWTAMRVVFHMPTRSPRCGSHIHVSLGRHRTFKLSQLKTLAYGIVLYEELILELLKADRVNNDYCKRNTHSSSRLQACNSNQHAIAQLINGVSDTSELTAVMQQDRYVLWNFDNIGPGKSGTLEFRGGRGLRGEVRTKRWIACTVALVDAILNMNDLRHPGIASVTTPHALYEAVKRSASRLAMREHLPDSYTQLNESRSSRT